MKFISITISLLVIKIFISFVPFILFSFLVVIELQSSFGNVNHQNNKTLNSMSEDPVVLINTTSLSNCLPSDSFKNNLSDSSIKTSNQLIDYQEL